jgi:hypothetical protein
VTGLRPWKAGAMGVSTDLAVPVALMAIRAGKADEEGRK